MLMLEARDVCGGATGRNGGQLRPHAYSRYPKWRELFGSDGALELIKHEMAHLIAFKELLSEEGIAEEMCFRLCETFDAAMSNEAWERLKGAYDEMVKDHGENGDVIRECRLIDDLAEAEDFTQMKGAIGAVVHPSGQIWPYKFTHALLRIVIQTGKLNLQANTPAQSVSQRDVDGWITVKTSRGDVRTKAVVHATNRWAGHLLPEFSKLIFPGRETLAAIKAPEGLIKRTGAQHWDSNINNYHLQLSPPYNIIILGGGKPVLAHHPQNFIRSDEENKQLEGVSDYFQSWPSASIVGWQGENPAELGQPINEGGVWTGIEPSSIDGFPWVGAVPDHDGQFIAAGFSGHGMPRILLSTAHIAPLVLKSTGNKFKAPSLVKPYPALPGPFQVTEDRLKKALEINVEEKYDSEARSYLESAKKPFCDVRGLAKFSSLKFSGS